MNRPKSGTIARNKTDRSTTTSKTPLNKQASPTKSVKRRSDQRSTSKTRQDCDSKASNTIVVCDRGTQCNRYSEGMNKLDPIESAQLLGVLKDLRGLKKDDTSSKVINHVEKLLNAAFSLDFGKSSTKSKQNSEVLALQTKLQKLSAQLEATNRKQMETNDLFQKEKDILISKFQEQKRLVETREAEIRSLVQKLHEEKKESEKQFKNQEKLKKQLNEEIQNKVIAEQYAKYEKEKSQIVSEYKDKLLEDLRLTLKDLQNSAVEQIVNFWEAEEDEELEKKFTCLSTSTSISEESSPYDTVPWKEETSQTNVSEASRARSDMHTHGFDNNLYSLGKEGNRVFHIEQDLVSLPNDDQPISENSYFARAPKPNN